MKNKYMIRTFAVLLTVMLCMTAFSTVAFASSEDAAPTSEAQTEPTGSADITGDDLSELISALFGSIGTEKSGKTRTVTTNGGKLNVRTGAGLDNYAFIINLPNINLGQLQIILAAAGLLSVLATVSCTLFLSAKCKDTLTVLLISIVVLLMPLFAYVAMGATWLSTILPSAGIGMQNNFLSQLADFNYLNIGGMSFWTPHVILISAGIELLCLHSWRFIPIADIR